MRIIYCTDLHADFDGIAKSLKTFIEERKPDLIVISGDLINSAYTSEAQIKKHEALMKPLMEATHQQLQSRIQTQKIDISPAEFFRCIPIIATEIIENQQAPQEVKKVVKDYLKNLEEAQDFMEMQYSIIKHAFPQALVLPGNYDMDLDDTELKEKNLHKQTKEFGEIKIAGYGGSATEKGMPLCPQTIPPELVVAFNEYIHEENLNSEPWAFLEEAKPTIAFTHTPPRGYCDKETIEVKGKKEIIETGSFGILEYAKRGLSQLICSGHIHSAVGVEKVRTENKKFTAVINPGNFGRVNGERGGNFAEIELENGRFTKATLYTFMTPNDPKSLLIRSKHMKTVNDDLTSLIVNSMFYY
ncbi:metallophosphoesterase [Candidatus Woesearchaeota archaeon]|nr:metallophosphoesterase [Candidatus Woesearchaeota archaeon]